MNDFQSDLDEVLAMRVHTPGCPGRSDEQECTCGATVIQYTAERFEEMRQALKARNDLARQCADLRGERDQLAEQVKALEPLATAGRDLVIAWEDPDDQEGLEIAQSSLKAAAEAWWDR